MHAPADHPRLADRTLVERTAEQRRADPVAVADRLRAACGVPPTRVRVRCRRRAQVQGPVRALRVVCARTRVDCRVNAKADMAVAL